MYHKNHNMSAFDMPLTQSSRF